MQKNKYSMYKQTREPFRLRTLKDGLFCLVLMNSISVTTAGTLEDIRARGTLHCGINEGLKGFAEQGTDKKWTGFDVDFCRAVAAAVLPTASTLLIDINKFRGFGLPVSII